MYTYLGKVEAEARLPQTEEWAGGEKYIYKTDIYLFNEVCE